MTPTPPSALLLAAAEAVARALDDGEFLESDVHRHELEAPILAALRPLLEDRLARADALDALEGVATEKHSIKITTSPSGFRVFDEGAGKFGSGPTLASAIAAARVPATPSKESEA